MCPYKINWMLQSFKHPQKGFVFLLNPPESNIPLYLKEQIVTAFFNSVHSVYETVSHLGWTTCLSITDIVYKTFTAYYNKTINSWRK